MIKMELLVSGMSCGHCKGSVEKVLRDLGVKEVNIDLKSGKIMLSYDESQISKEMIINSIEEAGYTVL